MTTIRHARGEFPVSDKFALFCPPEFLTMTHGELEAERQRLYRLSNFRFPFPLSDAELARLAQVTHVINVHNSLDVFDTWKPGDFGMGEADRLHGNLRHHPCNCKVHVVVDHHGELDAQGHMLVHLCRRHKTHTDLNKLMNVLQQEAEADAKSGKTPVFGNGNDKKDK